MNIAKRHVAIITFLMSWGSPLYAAEYYVAPNGSDSNPGTLAQPWKTLTKANATLTAGDTVYIRGGTYAGQQILPANSGKEGAQITYATYEGEIPLISGGGTQAALTGKSYITIDGIHFTAAGASWIRMEPADHITIRNSEFNGIRGGWGGVYIVGASYNKFQNNKFLALVDGTNIGPEDTFILKSSSYNLIENNKFQNALHYLINLRDSQSHHNVIRNNSLSNTWHAGIAIVGGSHDNVVEGNIIFDCGMDYLNHPTVDYSTWARFQQLALQMQGSANLFRYNVWINNGELNPSSNSGGSSTNNYFYNNTIYANYASLDFSVSTNPTGLMLTGNVFKNNIFANQIEHEVWSSYVQSISGSNYFKYNNFFGDAPFHYKSAYGWASAQTLYPAEWSGNMQKDPLFVKASNRDLRLRAGSPMIDAGAHLTNVTGASGSGTQFVVSDAKYFSNGKGVLQGDLIQVGTQTARITFLNYSTNTITVDRSISWQNGQGVSLPYVGARPDLGAYEWSGDARPQTPTGLGLSAQ